jgi:RNA polymerase sigma-70 factor, ECF subfamily
VCGGGDKLLDDQILYGRLKAGDEDALEALIERYHRPLYAFLYRLTDDQALADDLAQEVFIRLVKHQGEPPQYFRAWLFTIARNLAHDHFRSRNYRREQSLDAIGEEQTVDEAWGISPEHHAIYLDGQQEVITALQTLSAEQREVIILRFYHDMALSEIADITNAPLGTVKSRLFHALKRLKRQLVQAVEQHE